MTERELIESYENEKRSFIYENLRGADLSSADLSDADLSGADLSDANLRSADLGGTNLSGADLRGANLSGANLRSANLRSADLIGANLSGADLIGANLSSAGLRGANLSGADLRGVNPDFSSGIPFWCGGLDVIVDARIARQMAYHFCRLVCDDEEFISVRNSLIDFANKFHRVEECGLLEPIKKAPGDCDPDQAQS